MNLTVDASVVVKWFVPEAEYENARLVLGAASRLVAPDFAVIETLSVVWKKVRRGELDTLQAKQVARNISTYLDKFVAARDMAVHAGDQGSSDIAAPRFSTP